MKISKHLHSPSATMAQRAEGHLTLVVIYLAHYVYAEMLVAHKIFTISSGCNMSRVAESV
jgi:hypothetical protein